MNLTLTREQSTPEGTRGLLVIGDVMSFHTVELPWQENEKGRSCVPAGTYELEPFTRPNGDKVYRLNAPHLDVFKDETDVPPGIPGRSEILIHAANVPSQLMGCIAPGLGRGVIDGEPAVVQSRMAMEAIRAALGDKHHTLEILNGQMTSE